MSTDPPGIRGTLARLYDVFVDWPGRLSRELPGITQSLERAGARRVLDVGCGTGQHALALAREGYQVWGTDVSEEMLAQARANAAGAVDFFPWRLGDPPPPALVAHGPFDAVTCVGNVWPALTTDEDIVAAQRAILSLLRPGGLFLAGLKAVAVRRETGNPYLPLLKREFEGAPLFFLRFVDFDPGADDADLADFHMIIAGGDGNAGAGSLRDHRITRVRVWSPPALERSFADAGFEGVRVSSSLGDPQAPVRGEDVFVHARRPEARRNEA